MNPHDLTAFFEFVDANHAKHPLAARLEAAREIEG